MKLTLGPKYLPPNSTDWQDRGNLTSFPVGSAVTIELTGLDRADVVAVITINHEGRQKESVGGKATHIPGVPGRFGAWVDFYDAALCFQGRRVAAAIVPNPLTVDVLGEFVAVEEAVGAEKEKLSK